MNEIYYSDKVEADKIIKNIQQWWLNNIHILSDFDRTMTYSEINGEKKPSIISLMRDNPEYLWESYAVKAHQLFDYYHKFEIDNSISIKEKEDKMLEWWTKHLELLVVSWLNKYHISECVNSWILKLRSGVINFLEKTNNNNIPFVIITANGLWTDSIELFLQKEKLLFDNIQIVWNQFHYDELWNAIWYKSSIVHVFNKSEVALSQYPEIYDKIKNKKNVILLWDSLWDPDMIDWFQPDNILKIWFYNEKTPDNLEKYLEKYDVILTGDNNGEFLETII